MLAAETCGASRSAVESALKALIVAHGVRARKHKKPADLVNAAIRRHLEQREDFGFESTYSGRFAAQDRAHRSLEQLRRRGGVHWHERSRDQHRARASTRQVRHRARRSASGDHAAVGSSPEEPCRNGCVARGHRRARQQPRYDETRREHHEGRNQVAGDANARVGADNAPTRSNSTARPNDENPEQRRGVASGPNSIDQPRSREPPDRMSRLPPISLQT